MLICNYTVFVSQPPTEDQTQVIRLLRDHGYEPLVDGINGNNYHWFLKNYQNTPHRFFLIGDDLEAFTLNDMDHNMYIKPILALNYNVNDHITEHDWRIVCRHFNHVLFPHTSRPKIVSRRAQMLLQLPNIQKQIKEDFMDVEVDQGYQFQMEILEDRNICLCQVEKPNVDSAYTVVIRNFKDRGIKPFFTSLFISHSWGVSRYDCEFLKKLWDHFQMQGEFDLDAMLKEATEACYPNGTAVPIAEPEVYRKNMEETKTILQCKEAGTLFKSTL